MPGRGATILWSCIYFVSTSFLFCQQFERPFPSDKLTGVVAAPALAWTYGTSNYLSNPGFEQGTNDWILKGVRIFLKTNSSPAEGIKHLEIASGTVSRRVIIPPSQGVSFSFAYSTMQPSGFIVLDEQGSLLEQRILKYPDPPDNVWRYESLDLSAYSGRAVEVGLTFENFDFVPYRIDNFGLVPSDTGVAFDVYFGTSTNSLKKLGRTNANGWKLEPLSPATKYFWSVQAVTESSTNKSPVWQFTTGYTTSLARAVLSDLPARVCPGEPQFVTLSFLDELGFPSTSFSAPWAFYATSTSLAPASVLITELNPYSPEAIEFMNVSTQRVDLSNWRLQVWNYGDGAATAKWMALPDNVSLAPGEIFTVRDNQAQSVWPTLASAWPITWSSSSRLKGGAALRDAASNLVDAVFFAQDSSRAQIAGVSSNDWVGLPITNNISGKTIQRKGSSDQNDSRDWSWETPSLGVLNTGISLPFQNGFGPVPIIITRAAPTSSSALNKFITFSQPANDVTLWAAYSSGFGALGANTKSFTLTEPDKCVTLMAPDKLLEGDALPKRLTIKFGGPQPNDVTLSLKSSNPARLPLPASVLMPAGRAEVTVDINAPENSLFDGDTPVIISAEAEDMAFSTATVLVQDNEFATLEISGPSRIEEGASAEYTVKSSLTAASALPLTLTSAPLELLFPPFLNLSAGTNVVHFYLRAAENDFLDGDRTVRFSVTANLYSTVETTLVLLDNETNTITLDLHDGVEGGSSTGMVTLGGNVTSDVVVRLTSSRQDHIRPPAQVIVPKGSRSAEVTLEFPENTAKEGPQVATITAEADGFISTQTSVTVEDNDPATIQISRVLGPWIVGEYAGGFFVPQTITGRPLPDVNIDDLQQTLTGPNGPLALQELSIIRTEGGWFFRFKTLVAAESATFELKVSDLIGRVQQPIWPARTTNPISQLVYDKKRNQIIAAITSGELVAMPAGTGIKQSFSPPIMKPTLVALSPDGDFVFVAAQDSVGANIIVRADLTTLRVTLTWPIRIANDGTMLAADALAAIPGKNGEPSSSVAVLRRRANQPGINPPRTYDLAVFQPMGDVISAPAEGIWNGSVNVADDGSKIVVVQGSSARLFELTPTAMKELLLAPPITPIFDRVGHPEDVAFGPALFLTPHGQVFDPAVPALFANLPPFFSASAVTYDKAHALFAYYFGACCVRYYDPFTGRMISELSVPLALADLTSITPGGPNGLILLADSNIWFFQEEQSLIPTRQQADLSITSTSMVDPENPRVLKATFQISNQGPNTAEDATLAFALPSQTTFISSNPALPSVQTGTLLSGFSLGTLNPNDSREITVLFTSGTAGDLRFAAFVGSNATDPNTTNNRAEGSGSITLSLPPPPPQLRISLIDPSQIKISFKTTPGWKYSLQNGNDPTAFFPIGQTILGTGQDQEFPTWTIFNREEYFRVIVEP